MDPRLLRRRTAPEPAGDTAPDRVEPAPDAASGAAPAHDPAQPATGSQQPGPGSSQPANPPGQPSPKRSQHNVEEDLEEDADRAQPGGEDGVETDMATVVLNPPFAGLAGAAQAGRSHPVLDPNSGDAEVMLRVRDGDDRAFDYLIEKYRRPIVNFMYRMVHNQAVAEELAQEVFLRVYRSRHTYRAEARFTTWLYRIATNLGVNYARDTRYERTVQNVYLDQPDPETGTMPDVADATPTVEHDLVRQERMRAIRQHVMALPERQRNAVLMHKYQGLDYKQIGEVLKLSESATKSLLFRAYQALRERLKEYV